jgi:hypothetical protein
MASEKSGKIAVIKRSSIIYVVNLLLLKLKVERAVPVIVTGVPRHEGIMGEWRYISTHSLTSALDGGEWSSSRPGHFTPRERAPGTNWIGGWVGPGAVLDVVKRKIPSPGGNRTLEPRSSSP